MTPLADAADDAPAGIDRVMWIDAPPAVVFAHLSEPDRIARWMGRSVAFDARPGGQWRIDYNGTDIATGEVLEIDPPNRLVYSWGWETPGEIVRPGESTVEFVLTPEDGGTRLRLRHTGLPAGEVAGHAQGWDQFLPALATAAPR